MAARQDELHDLVAHILTRVYHEDNLLVQRMLAFLTVHSFLIVGLTINWSFGQSKPPLVILFAAFGISLTLVQLTLGAASVAAISFWRHYARLAESKIEMPIDSAMHLFFRDRKVATPAGEIIGVNTTQVEMRTAFSGVARGFSPSTNWVVATILPALVYIFWASFLLIGVFEYEVRLFPGVAFILIILMLCSVSFARRIVPRISITDKGDSAN